jgi:hypothetical protein
VIGIDAQQRKEDAMSQCTHVSSGHAAGGGAARGFRELASRESGGVSVRLFWNPREDEVFVHVQSERDNEDFVLNPSKSDALFAYHHPYAAANQALKAGRIAA